MPDQQKYNKLAGKRVLILGGSSGIGYAVAEASLEGGAAAVIISSSSADKVSDAVKRLQTAYPSRAASVSGHTCDVASPDTMEANLVGLLDFATANKAHKLDHAVVTAGRVGGFPPLAELSATTIQEFGVVRVVAPLLLAKHLPAYAVAGPEASLTLTSGSVVEKPLPGMAVAISYATAVRGVTRSLALDLAPLRVNCVLPGATATELWAALPDQQRLGFEEKFLPRTPVGFMSGPENVAESYVYFMKDYNCTANTIVTDGGNFVA